MLKPLENYLERRRQLERHAGFVRDIERYRSEVLGPRDLSGYGAQPLVNKRRRLVFMGEDRVWKFYRSSRRDARNTIAASEMLHASGIPVPTIEFSDVTRETQDRYRLSCIVMKRIEGRTLDRDPSPDETLELARFLARLHSVRSDKWGECCDPKPDRYVEDYFLGRLRPRLELIEPWLSASGESPLPDILTWFEHRREALSPPGDQFCMVSADAHSRNFMRLGGDKLCMVDLDRTRFLDFPVDLLQCMPLETPLREVGPDASRNELIKSVEANSRDFLEAYFSAAPPEFQDHWERTRQAHLLFQMTQKLYGAIRRKEAKFSLFKSVDEERVNRQGRFYCSVIRRLVEGAESDPIAATD